MGRHRLGFGSNSGSMQGAIVLDRLAQWCFSLLGSRYFAELQILRYGLIKIGAAAGWLEHNTVRWRCLYRRDSNLECVLFAYIRRAKKSRGQ